MNELTKAGPGRGAAGKNTETLPQKEPESSPVPCALDQSDQSKSYGWFRAMRTNDALALLKENHYAFILAYIIAFRGQYSEVFNRYNLALGEALLGKYEDYGMSERQYRTAKEQLAKWGFATFRPTSKGTVAKLLDTRVFAIFRVERDGQHDRQATDSRRASDGQPTTTKISKKEKNEKNTRIPAPPVEWKTESIDLTK